MSAASVLQKRGKEAIVTQILGYLDWRSLLHASEVSGACELAV